MNFPGTQLVQAVAVTAHSKHVAAHAAQTLTFNQNLAAHVVQVVPFVQIVQLVEHAEHAF
jgi:hypothetical protein